METNSILHSNFRKTHSTLTPTGSRIPPMIKEGILTTMEAVVNVMAAIETIHLEQRRRETEVYSRVTTLFSPGLSDQSMFISLILSSLCDSCLVFGSRRMSRNIRQWRYDHQGNLWTRGSRAGCFGRFFCCTIMIVVFLVISILLSLALVCLVWRGLVSRTDVML